MSTIYLSFLTLSLIICISSARISDKRLCADIECKTPVAQAKALRRYFSPDEYKLSFNANQDIIVYSKSAGSDESLWGVEINGKRGYVPKHLIRETKTLIKPTILVDTETTNIPNEPQVPSKEEKVNPSKVKENYEVIDGTTIYASASDEIVQTDQKPVTETPTDPLVNENTDIPINIDDITKEVNILSDVSSEDLKETKGSKIIVSESGDTLVPENSKQKSEQVEVTENVPKTLKLENVEDKNIVQDTDSSAVNQEKKDIRNIEVETITEDVGQIKEEDSEESLDEYENIINTFSFMSNALNNVLGTDESPNKAIKEKENVEHIVDNPLNGTETNISNEKQEIDLEVKNEIVSNENPSVVEGNFQNNIPSDSDLNNDSKDSSNTEQQIGNLSSENNVPPSLGSLPVEKLDIVEESKSQDSINKQSEDVKLESEVDKIKNVLSIDQVVGNSAAKVESDIPNVPNIIEDFSNENSTSGENSPSLDSIMKPSDELKLENDVQNSKTPLNTDQLIGNPSNSLDSIDKLQDITTNENLLSQNSTSNVFGSSKLNTGETVSDSDIHNSKPLDTEKLTSSESVNDESGTYDNNNAQSLKLEDQNVFKLLQNNIPTISENNKPNTEEKPESIDKSLEDSNEFVHNTDSGISNDSTSNNKIDSNSEQETYTPEPTDSTPSYYNNVYNEQNSVHVTDIPSNNPVGTNDLAKETDTPKTIDGTPHYNIYEQNTFRDHYNPSYNTIHNDNLKKETYTPTPTNDKPHYHEYEQNTIQDNPNPSYNTIATNEMPNINVVAAESYLNREQVQNVQSPESPVEIRNEQNENIASETSAEIVEKESPNIFSYFGGINEEARSDNGQVPASLVAENLVDITEDREFKKDVHAGDYCTKEDCPNQEGPKISDFTLSMDVLNFSSDIFLYLVTTAVSVMVFLLGHFVLDKSRREGPLLVKINKLEKEFLILMKEKEILTNQLEKKDEEAQQVDSEEFLNLKEENEMLELKVQSLEENVQILEKELENSTEVGLELNRMLSEVLNSENAGQTLMSNIEGLQEQLAEQQDIVSSMKEVLSLKETENHELNLELDIANKRVSDLQTELDKLISNIMKLEESKKTLENNTETQINQLNSTISSLKNQLDSYQKEYTTKIEDLNNDLTTSQHNLQLKTKEFEGLKNSVQQLKEVKNANTLESLLEVNSIKAELEQLKVECQGHCDKLRKERDTNMDLEKKVKVTEKEIEEMKSKYDETDKTRLELETKLQVLTNYFKEKEEQLQKELSKYESMWSAKQGEATSTSEKIKYLQSEVQNYKAQNETLKQEIVSQEVELKGQISVLEKKVHENWVSARQAERRLEELKQEAAQLRNRLTLRERALQDDRLHNRMQSPLEQTGDLPISPMHLESPASPPLLYNSRDHITKSPPILGMPPPFLPPPTGSSFLPPPPSAGAPYLPPPPLPFMPPPPHDMFPGDHRPPPLGRMSSPPLNSRYSPSRPYSPYDRSPSPSYDESEYGTSPVHRRNYSQYNRRRDHRPAAMEKFNGRSGTLSSGSENSNESLDEINHQNSKV